MSDMGSITHALDRILSGEAGQPERAFFDAFFARLVNVAKAKLNRSHLAEDAEDVALSAMRTFMQRAKEGQFTDLEDRDSIWTLLTVIALRKTASLQRKAFADCRDFRRIQALEDFVAEGPSEAFFDRVVTEANRLFEVLPNNELREVATLRMHGYTNSEIATRLETSLATVKRRLSVVKRLLASELGGD
jgi:DNA-directed RNA polymerase specialized sigma24 family protein